MDERPILRRLISRVAGWIMTALGVAILVAPVLIAIGVGRWIAREVDAAPWPALLRLVATCVVWPLLIVVVFRLWFSGLARVGLWCVGRVVRRYALSGGACGAVLDLCSGVPGAGDGDGQAELLQVEEERRAVGAEA